jgi:hypothetical protein
MGTKISNGAFQAKLQAYSPNFGSARLFDQQGSACHSTSPGKTNCPRSFAAFGICAGAKPGGGAKISSRGSGPVELSAKIMKSKDPYECAPPGPLSAVKRKSSTRVELFSFLTQSRPLAQPSVHTPDRLASRRDPSLFDRKGGRACGNISVPKYSNSNRMRRRPLATFWVTN